MNLRLEGHTLRRILQLLILRKVGSWGHTGGPSLPTCITGQDHRRSKRFRVS